MSTELLKFVCFYIIYQLYVIFFLFLYCDFIASTFGHFIVQYEAEVIAHVHLGLQKIGDLRYIAGLISISRYVDL